MDGLAVIRKSDSNVTLPHLHGGLTGPPFSIGRRVHCARDDRRLPVLPNDIDYITNAGNNSSRSRGLDGTLRFVSLVDKSADVCPRRSLCEDLTLVRRPDVLVD